MSDFGYYNYYNYGYNYNDYYYNEEDYEPYYDDEEEYVYYNYGNKNNTYFGKKIFRNYSSNDDLENFYKYNHKNNFYNNFYKENGYFDFDFEDENDNKQDSYEFNYETGDIGEKLVYDELKNIKNLGNIKWMNKKGESFEPYDFKIIKGKKIIYIDAKSTIFEKGDDPFPIISENEQEFIINLKNNEKYYIARVFDTRGENPKIVYYDVKTMEKISKYKIGI